MRQYEPTDYPEIAAWHVAHGEEPPSPDLLPRLGLIEPGVAAGFLYRTDAALALIENFISNPSSGPKERHEALDAITDTLVIHARLMGFRHVVALTDSRAITRRAIRHGFRSIGHREMLVRET